MGYTVIHEPIDFFTENRGDIVVTNPPFSIKRNVLERLKGLDKPFILIMPSAVVMTNYMRNLFGEQIQLIVPQKRIQFTKVYNDGRRELKNKCNFDCIYYCFKCNLPRDIVFLAPPN
jgi:hypothetical protein